MRSLRKYYALLIVLLLLIGISVLLYYINPTEIVQYIGVENTYLVVFLLAAIGGLSTITGTSFFTAIATFSSGGSHPLLLGLAGGIGIFISDTAFYFIARYGRTSVPERWQSKIYTFKKWTETKPTWLIMLGIFLYVGLSPFPNDLLMIALVIADFKYRKIAPVLLAGSITIATVTAYIARFGLWLF